MFQINYCIITYSSMAVLAIERLFMFCAFFASNLSLFNTITVIYVKMYAITVRLPLLILMISTSY